MLSGRHKLGWQQSFSSSRQKIPSDRESKIPGWVQERCTLSSLGQEESSSPLCGCSLLPPALLQPGSRRTVCHFTTPSTLTVQADLAERVKGRVRQQLSRSQRKTQTLKGPKLLRKLPPNSKKKAKLPCCWSLCGGRRMGLKHMCKVGSQGTEGDQKPPSRCSCLSFKGRNSF